MSSGHCVSAGNFLESTRECSFSKKTIRNLHIKSHTESPVNSLFYLTLIVKQHLIWLLITMKCLWSIFVVFICCLHAVFAWTTTKICSKFLCKMCNIITGTECVNPCINYSPPKKSVKNLPSLRFRELQNHQSIFFQGQT